MRDILMARQRAATALKELDLFIRHLCRSAQWTMPNASGEHWGGNLKIRCVLLLTVSSFLQIVSEVPPGRSPKPFSLLCAQLRFP